MRLWVIGGKPCTRGYSTLSVSHTRISEGAIWPAFKHGSNLRLCSGKGYWLAHFSNWGPSREFSRFCVPLELEVYEGPQIQGVLAALLARAITVFRKRRSWRSTVLYLGIYHIN